jgi:NADPH:quinone reductase-like Zn-dependent oxidoreductase
MKAAVYYETGSPDVLKYEDVADPPCYPSGVVIRSRRSASRAATPSTAAAG